ASLLPSAGAFSIEGDKSWVIISSAFLPPAGLFVVVAGIDVALLDMSIAAAPPATSTPIATSAYIAIFLTIRQIISRISTRRQDPVCKARRTTRTEPRGRAQAEPHLCHWLSLSPRRLFADYSKSAVFGCASIRREQALVL